MHLSAVASRFVPELLGSLKRRHAPARARWARRRSRLGLAGAAVVLLASAAAWGGGVTLKNGLQLEGKVVPLPALSVGPQKPPASPIPNYPVMMIASDLQRYYVSRLQVIDVNKDTELSRMESFTLPQQPRGRAGSIQSAGAMLEATRFDSFGRRTVVVQGANRPIIQGITRLTPQYAKIEALNVTQWETAIATSSIPVDDLEAILRQATKPDSPDHRLAIARFLMQAGLYREAQRELAAIRAQFTDLVETVDEVALSLLQLQAQQLLGELKLRKAAGQHRLVLDSLRKFPTDNVNATVLREVRELVTAYEVQEEQLSEAALLLGELEAQLTDPRQRDEVRPLRAMISEKLGFNTLDRLGAFLQQARDPQLSPAEKLALAISGWVAGSAHADPDLALAIRLWQARTILLDYFRTPNDALAERQAMLERLQALEGISIERIVQMLPQLPPAIEAEAVEPGMPQTIEVPSPDGKETLQYRVLLPHEYSPDRRYPAIVALHHAQSSPDAELHFWGGTSDQPGQAPRHGYIVIAPEYTDGKQKNHDYSAASHLAVLTALKDARQRFAIDSDRVFLTGHGTGGDATFDIAFAHPDLFAGAIPIAGISDKHCQFTWQNGKDLLPVYVVLGELDRDSMARNNRELTRMINYGLHYDLIVAEFVGAGYDSFYAEIHKLFAWMDRHRRARLPAEFEARTLRTSDNRFYWLEFDGLPAAVLAADWSSERSRKTPLTVSGRVTPGNTLHVTCKARSCTIWLSPDVIKFDERLSVRINGTLKWNDFLKPDLGALLEDVRRRGDRQQLFWAVLEF